MSTFDAIVKGEHHRIIPTARYVAYFRTFSEIPYAKETSKALGGEDAAREIFQDDLDLVAKYSAPFMEARYKCFDRVIATRKSVFELAVGTSVLRGLSILDNPNGLYIGTDLPEMIASSRAFLEKMNVKMRQNFHLEVANVLAYEELIEAARHLTARRDIVIINEGLWGYLTTEEQVVATENIRKLLERYGGEWVTPDIWDLESDARFVSSLGPDIRSAMPAIFQRVKSVTGRDFHKNYFANRQEAIRHFQTFGFDVSQYPMVDELQRLTSIATLWEEQDRHFCENALQQQRVWVMSLR